MPRISVVIPTFNDAATLPATLASVLAQDRPADEVIVVNDAGADPAGFLGPLPGQVRLLTLPENRGASGARNAGLAASTGDFVHFLDSDDLAAADFLRHAGAALAARPEAGFAIADALRVPEAEMAATPLPAPRAEVPADWLDPARLFAHVAAHTGFYLPSVTLWNRARIVASERGEFLDTRLAAGEDFQLYLRMALRHGAVHLGAPLGIHRIRPGSLSKNAERVWSCRMRGMDMLLDEDPVLRGRPEARRLVLDLRRGAARRTARILAGEGRRAEARALLHADLSRAPSLKSALSYLRLMV